ncbi:MAG TPA: PRC-barrel domain-containing protein [Anaerolineales bacterium]
MLNLELREGAGVFTPGDEQVGKVSGFVLDPATNEVTHLVVQKGWLLPEDKVVPFDMVTSATEDKVILNEGMESFDELPAFEETHFIKTRQADAPEPDDRSPLEETTRTETAEPGVIRAGRPGHSYNPAYYWYPPHGYVGYPVGYYGWPPMEKVRNIPEDTISLKEGTDVISSDGEHVGDVERLLVDPGSNKATHFVISQGVFFKDRKLVPAHWVRSVGEHDVHLSVTARLLEQLPSYEA